MTENNTYEYQRAVSEFVSREVQYPVSMLVSSLQKLAWAGCDTDVLDREDQEALTDLGVTRTDYKEAAQQEGWERVDSPCYVFTDKQEIVRLPFPSGDGVPWRALAEEKDLDLSADPEEVCKDAGWEHHEDATFVNPDTGEVSEAEDWLDLCSDEGIEPYEWEAYEHWIVSNWLGRKLTERGYTVREVLGLTIWARGTTGQSISMDGVINEIYREVMA
jgi:hypothetical protein